MCMKTVVTIATEISICVENQELPVQTGASPSVLVLELNLQAAGSANTASGASVPPGEVMPSGSEHGSRAIHGNLCFLRGCTER